MSYQLKQVNNIEVKPLSVPHLKPEEIAGYDLIPMAYANIYIVGKKGSGKTNVTFTILKNCIDKNTNVIVFCSTQYSDSNWEKIKSWLEKRNQPHIFFSSIYDENGDSNLDAIVERIKEENKAIQEAKNKKKDTATTTLPPPINLFPEKEKKEEKQKEAKKKGPAYLFIFDDISNDLRVKKDVQALMKHMRHYKSKVIISSQYPTDLDPPARSQVDIWCLFKGFGLDKIEKIYPQLNLDIDGIKDPKSFYNLYASITNPDHTFLYINTNKNDLRKNFNEQILLK